MQEDKLKYDEILMQLQECLRRPNAGLIKVELNDGTTVVGKYEEDEFSINHGGGFITLSSGKSFHYSVISRIE
jgi:hypothetical protein